MKWLIGLAIVGLAFASEPRTPVTPPTHQVAYMVWGRSCIQNLEIGPSTQIETPMKDGEPDMDNAVIVGVIAHFTKSCGMMEIRREK